MTPWCTLASSEGDASFPWNKVVLGQQLRFCLGFSAGEVNYAVQNLLAHLPDGLLPRNNAPRVNVDDVRHLLRKLRIRGDFHHWRDGISCRRSQAGRKQNDVRSRTHLGGDALHVVARCALEVEPRLG